MKNKLFGFLALAFLFNLQLSTLHAQGTAFTYQGRLNDGANPANGAYDLTFTLFNALNGGAVLGTTNVFNDVVISDGLVTVMLDYGARFDGNARWLQIAVRPGASTGPYTNVTPRQALLPAPYAMTAGTVPDGAITGAKVDATTVQRRVTGTAPVGSFITGINADGSVTAAAGSGGDIWALNGSSAYYNGGRVGIGSTTPAAALEVSSPNGNALIYATAPRPNLILRDTVAGNARSVIGGVDGGLRFYTESWENGVNPSAFIAFTTNGNFGIGTVTPSSKLHIFGGSDAVRLTGSQPFLTLEDTSAGLYSRIQADGAGMNFKTQGAVTGSNPSGLLHLDGVGNVGIGSSTPNHRLRVSGGPTWTANGWMGSVELENAAAIAWRANGAGSRFGIGQSGGGLYFFSSASDPGTANNPANYNMIISDAGNVGIGTTTPSAKLHVVGTIRTSVVTITGGADLAEPFPTDTELPKGSVVVIDEEHTGQLKRSEHAYDTRVAGIISGANGVSPGISLQQEGVFERGQNVALTGRVYVQADATYGGIKPGDLLTTSDTPGHAMKVADHAKAQGAILGKAMSALKAGKGLVLVLVTLQ
jgi:hypothetical protein